MNIGFLERFSGGLDIEMEIYYKILIYNGIPFQRLQLSDPLLWDKLSRLDFFIYKWGHLDDHHQIAKTILPIIENQLNVRCFPDQKTCWHYDDKIKQYYLLKELDFPVAESYVFWDKQSALEWSGNAIYPIIFKLKGGAGSLNVILVENKFQAKLLIRRMFGSGVKQGSFGTIHFLKLNNYSPIKIVRNIGSKVHKVFLGKDTSFYYRKHKNYAYFQKFYTGNEFDTRVTTAGKRVHAFRRFVRKNDFRASGSNKWDINPDNIDRRLLKIAIDISTKLGFQAMAYDFIYDENKEPKIVEMSYLYGGAGFPDFMNGYWDKELDWHPGRFWPQYFELIDLLGISDLKLPKLDTDTSYKKAKMVLLK